jgi:hypothetical protein
MELEEVDVIQGGIDQVDEGEEEPPALIEYLPAQEIDAPPSQPQGEALEEEILSGRRAIEIELSGRFAFESVALI